MNQTPIQVEVAVDAVQRQTSDSNLQNFKHMGRLDLMIEHESGYKPNQLFKRGGMIDSTIEKKIERRYQPKKEEEAKKKEEAKKEEVKKSPRRIHEEEEEEDGEGVTESEMYKDYDLYLAAKNGDLDDFKRILDRLSSSPVTSVDIILSRLSPNGNTFLHVAATHGNQGVVNFIASMKPSLVLAKNLNGETALHLVARGGDESMVEALVKIHRDFLVQNPESNNLLMAKNERGNTAVHEALLSGRNSIAQYLIGENPELSYQQNNTTSSPLYLAARFGFVDCVSLILQLCTDEERVNELFKKKSPIKAAIKRRQIDVLDTIFNANPRLIQMRDGEGRNPLHFAASLGHLEEARHLLKRHALNATRRDKNGILPVHLASYEGHVDIIRLLLQDFPEPRELLDKNGCNILHIAAKSGRYNVFRLVLENPDLDYLINMKDRSGNTPLHWATWCFNPKMVNALTWDKRVDVKAFNNNGMSALDVAEYHMSYNPPFKQRLTWAALKSVGIPRNFSENKDWSRSKKFDMDDYRERVNTLLLVATLVATVTFAAGFTMPGGYVSSDSGSDADVDLGMATMLRDKGFHVFVFCDTLAMYSSIVVATTLIWAQLGDLKLALTAMTLALPLLGIALSMMSMAFTAGIIIVVSKLKWLSTTILAMGICFVAILFLLLLPLCSPLTSRNRILRYLSYYPFCLLMLAS